MHRPSPVDAPTTMVLMSVPLFLVDSMNDAGRRRQATKVIALVEPAPALTVIVAAMLMSMQAAVIDA
jgi:hypothetical protein